MSVNRKLTRVIFVVCALSADCLWGVTLHRHTLRLPDIAASTVVM